jgi:hypothetical protein
LGIDVEVSVKHIIENEIYYNDDRYTTVASFTVDNISETSMDITTSEYR